MDITISHAKTQLLQQASTPAGTLFIHLPDMVLRVEVDQPQLLRELHKYFAPVLGPATEDAPLIEVYERPSVGADLAWQEWAREPGKVGRKDQFIDVSDGRLHRKAKTGMVFLQSSQHSIAIGPCAANPNQVINFINNRYMTALQQDGWLICHAAACVLSQQGVAFAGFSGGGKSTSMLHLMDQPDTAFVSNDRLFIRAEGDRIIARGIAKWPRINPGTILNNPTLLPMLSQEKADALAQLPKDKLWELEDKYDVDIDALYGPGRIVLEHELNALVLLDWHRNADQPFSCQQEQLKDLGDTLQALMKSSGPFYCDRNGTFQANQSSPDHERYPHELAHCPILVVRGCTDFAALSQAVQEFVSGQGTA